MSSSGGGGGGEQVEEQATPLTPLVVGGGDGAPPFFRQPAMREIHKNAWLKSRVGVVGGGDSKNSKKPPPTPKVLNKSRFDRNWVVFCVHDDREAFLEFYREPKEAATHSPFEAISLNSCLHISPSILAQHKKECQFVITLNSQVIPLIAHNWEQMMEWVESLQAKLRHMNLISPKDNLYSKLPETNKVQVVSTRDPNSPLPPTPAPPPRAPPPLNSNTVRCLSSEEIRGGGGVGGPPPPPPSSSTGDTGVSRNRVIGPRLPPPPPRPSSSGGSRRPPSSLPETSSCSSSSGGGLSSEVKRGGQRSSSSENVYEYLYTPPPPPPPPNNSSRKGNSFNLENGNCPPAPPRPTLRLQIRNGANGGVGNGGRSSSLTRLRDSSPSSSSTSGRRERRGGELEGGPHPPPHQEEGGGRRRGPGRRSSSDPLEGIIGLRGGEYRIGRDEEMGVVDSSSSNLPLKEQQVIHLRREMAHPAGVRVTLRKKDCLNTIAFVDYLGAVWIAGWKQRENPVLYYAFHVGDQVLKVGGVTVHSSSEVTRAIRMVSSMQVELIVGRVPYGRVFVIKRSIEGEPLGLVAEGSSGEISLVLESGLAFAQGFPSTCVGVGGGPSHWYLTEINGRPLSLFSRDNQVKERLNAVGKQISLLVQPADLVKTFKKALKTHRPFKDYILG